MQATCPKIQQNVKIIEFHHNFYSPIYRQDLSFSLTFFTNQMYYFLFSPFVLHIFPSLHRNCLLTTMLHHHETGMLKRLFDNNIVFDGLLTTNNIIFCIDIPYIRPFCES